MTCIDKLRSARTFLFVLGDRPDRFDTARESAADVAAFDLGDVVAERAKVVARREVAAWPRGGQPWPI